MKKIKPKNDVIIRNADFDLLKADFAVFKTQFSNILSQNVSIYVSPLDFNYPKPSKLVQNGF